MSSEYRDTNMFIIIRLFLDEIEESKLDFGLIIDVCKSIDSEFFLDKIEVRSYDDVDDKIGIVLTVNRKKLNATNIFDRITTELKGIHVNSNDESGPHFIYEFDGKNAPSSKPLEKKIRNGFLTDVIQQYEKKCKEVKDKFNKMIYD